MTKKGFFYHWGLSLPIKVPPRLAQAVKITGISSFSRENVSTRSGRLELRMSDKVLVLRARERHGVQLGIMETRQTGNTNKQTNNNQHQSHPCSSGRTSASDLASLWPELRSVQSLLCKACVSTRKVACVPGESHRGLRERTPLGKRGCRLQSHTVTSQNPYPPSCAQRLPLSISRAQ